jgi:sulfotransferase
MARYHFLSGLPRSGSTLLAALLRQNSALHAAMSSPVASIVTQTMRAMSQENEGAVFIDDAQRARILRGAVDGYYADIAGACVFDTNRLWCAKLPLIAALWPDAKIVACVRNPAWVLDSVERLTRTNALQPSGIFRFDPAGNVYSRAEGLMAGNGLIGFSLNSLRDAVFDSRANRLLLVRFETLVADPARALAAIYDHVGLAPFDHDFETIEPDYDAMLFDQRIGAPGLHAVGARVHREPRPTVLPPDLYDRYVASAFWDAPDGLPEHVRLV